MKQFLRISRFRFWHYLVGPWLVGIAAAMPDASVFLHWGFWAGILYWSLPANLLVYGVNDIADGDTDKYNPKKQGYEGQVEASFVARLGWVIALLNFPIGAGFIFFDRWDLFFVWMLWLFFSVGYSLNPIRAKARPFLDGVFNALYYMPGILAYIWAGGQEINIFVLIALQAWVMAMHAYSAVPDIEADTKAGLATTATALGPVGCLLYCGALWLLAAVLVVPVLGLFGVLGGIIYVGFCLINLFSVFGKKSLEAQKIVFGWYKYFPVLNFLFGMALFWYFYFPICIMVLKDWNIISL